MNLTSPLVSAPGVRGCVYLLKDLEVKLTGDGVNMIEDIADLTLCSQEEYARFGTSFAVLDVNKDGVSDLLVGHPYSGAERLQYQGGVSVYLGQISGGNFSLSSSPHFTISCSDQPCSLGQVMTQSDHSVMVGAPTAGAGGRLRGAVLEVMAGEWEEGREYLVPGDLDWLVTGSQDFQQFGSSLSADQGLVAVGSPSYRVAANGDSSFSAADLEMAGRVSVFSVSGSSVTLLHQETGESQSSSLGSSSVFTEMKVGGERRRYLAIGQPSSDSTSDQDHVQTGSVLLLDLVTSRVNVSLSGDLEVGRFGMRLTRGWEDGLIVSAPYAGLGVRNHGKVYYYSGVEDLPSGDITSQCQSSHSPCTEEWASLVLTTEEEESLFGCQVSWDRSGQDTVLAVAAERSSLGSRMGGAVYLYHIKPE